jgi:hypothetical protein
MIIEMKDKRVSNLTGDAYVGYRPKGTSCGNF